jgi:hypothetical protein
MILLARTIEFVHIEQISALFKFRLIQVSLYFFLMGKNATSQKISTAAYSLWMYSCKGSFHPVQKGHTSAKGLFHLFSRWEGLLHSGNPFSRQQMHQTGKKNISSVLI